MSKHIEKPPQEASAEVKQVVERLATGFIIRAEDLGGYDGHDYWLEKSERHRMFADQISRMIQDGWLDSFNGGYRLTDEGRKAYLRSTDELGDGKLYLPFPTTAEPK